MYHFFLRNTKWFIMKIYVLSLPRDKDRRKKLFQSFINKSSDFLFFEAFNKEQAQDILISKNIMIKKPPIPISLSEIACSLGHKAILEDMIQLNLKFSLILEDDVIGIDQDIDKIDKIMTILPEGSILIAGGLDGLKSLKSLYGFCVNEELKVFKIPKIYYRYLARTCCYLISYTVAQQIIEKQTQALERADNWEYLLDQCNQVYYSPILKHPIDLQNSHIEQERQLMKGKGLMIAIIREGVIHSIYHFFRKIILSYWAWYKGYIKIKNKE